VPVAGARYTTYANMDIRSSREYESDVCTLHQTEPNGHTGRAYLTAVVGTHTMMKMRSATARLTISRLVAVRARRYNDTTSTTTRLPTKPVNTISPNNIGTTIARTFSNESSSSCFVLVVVVVVVVVVPVVVISDDVLDGILEVFVVVPI